MQNQICFQKMGITGKVEALDLDDFKCARFYANYFSPRDDENINTKYTSEFFIHIRYARQIHMQRII